MAHCHISPCIRTAAQVFPYNSPTLDNTGPHKHKVQLGKTHDTKIPQPDPKWMQTSYMQVANTIICCRRVWAVILYRPVWKRRWVQCGLAQSRWLWMRFVPRQAEQCGSSNQQPRPQGWSVLFAMQPFIQWTLSCHWRALTLGSPLCIIEHALHLVNQGLHHF